MSAKLGISGACLTKAYDVVIHTEKYKTVKCIFRGV